MGVITEHDDHVTELKNQTHQNAEWWFSDENHWRFSEENQWRFSREYSHETAGGHDLP